MKKIFITGCLGIFVFAFSSFSKAQTTFKKDSGIFVNPIESLRLEEEPFGPNYLIGPAVGYRFDRNWDLLLHAEFLFSEYNFDNSKVNLLNLGITGGYTADISRRLNYRAELSLYKVFEFKGNALRGTRFLNSGLGSSSLYWEVPLFRSVTFSPNFGVIIGYGADTNQLDNASSIITNDFDGFVYGPRIGLDTIIRFSNSFYLVISPTARMYYNRDRLTEIGLNFKFNI